MNSVSPALIERAAQLIKEARHAVVFTGAGISTPSGIPDFRSAESGLWTRDDPMEVASLTSFRRTPEKFYNWINPLVRTMTAAQPNAAHVALAELEKAGFVKAVITQNIDALHQKAGSQTVIEVHGSMDIFNCPGCGASYPSMQFVDTLLNEEIPHCPKCGRVVKPGIILYEELLPADAWSAAEYHTHACDIMLVVGSSLETMPAAMLPHQALRNHARLIINTFSATTLDGQADIVLRGDIVDIIPQIARAVLV
jgi:NAD-dependent deacetylase